MRYLLISILLVGCGSKGDGQSSSIAASVNDSIFQDWNVAIPNSEASAIQTLAEANNSPTVSQSYAQTYSDIVVNKRLNLSQLKPGKNTISQWQDTTPCTYKSVFSISVYTSGQIVLMRERTRSTNVNCLLPDVTDALYYKYTVVSGRVTVCGYDDANYTLERGCMSN